MPLSDKEYLEARLNDAIRQCELRGAPKFVGFLSESQSALAKKIGTKTNAKFSLFGGYDLAERVYFGIFPDWCEIETKFFPIVRLKIVNKSAVSFSHRDVLGAVMALGLKRDTVGDIIVGEKISYMFIAESVAEYLIQQLTKIASSGVEVSVDNTALLPQIKTYEDLSDTVASTRLDCVVAAICRLSRSAAVEAIVSGRVLLNGFETIKPTAEVEEKSVISVRQHGKFVVYAITDKTKKGRIVLKYKKYI